MLHYLDYVASNGMIYVRLIGKDLEGGGRDLMKVILRRLPGRTEETRGR
jgi:hypothetical protein